jgi:glycosyltransferase involved in cell wall biosynthesis
MQAPTVTVITVVYNGERYIERTLRSVQSQREVAWDHLIVDGASSDGTLSVVKRFEHVCMRVVSEPDRGIYDAMNKGIRLALGTFIIFINAGDEFADERSLQRALQGHTDADFIYGNTLVVDDCGAVLGDRRLSPPESLSWRSFQRGMCVSHQSMIIRRSLALPFDLQYKISADIDWTIRVLKQCKNIVNARCYIARFLEGGVSAARRQEGLKERFRIMSSHYGLIATVFNHLFILIRYPVQRLFRKSMT